MDFGDFQLLKTLKFRTNDESSEESTTANIEL